MLKKTLVSKFGSMLLTIILAFVIVVVTMGPAFPESIRNIMDGLKSHGLSQLESYIVLASIGITVLLMIVLILSMSGTYDGQTDEDYLR
jgi:choline-glycine betaine transporter